MKVAAELADRFRRDFEALAGPALGKAGLAVSGGPDSLALLLLATAALPGRVEAATVDHGLRSESAAEAAFVADLCARLGVPHATLRPSEPITGNLQSAARAARYALLADWAIARDLCCLATAHHVDDQAETLIMRLLRGAGLPGLAGIRARTPAPADAPVPLVRPLLGWRRAELAAIVAAAGIEPVADSTNVDERFDRSRIRRRLAETEWLEPEPIARSAAALAEAEDAARWVVEGLWRGRVERDGEACVLNTEGLPAEFRRRLVLAILDAMQLGPAPRGDEVGRLLATLEKGRAATLAGVRCSGGDEGLWRFEPAPPRRSG